MGGALCYTVLDLVRTLLDFRTFACDSPYTQFPALVGVLRPVEAYARKAHTEYLTHARVLDRKIHHTANGAVGPIEAKLLVFSALGEDHAHEVIGFMVGALASSSPAFCGLHELADHRALPGSYGASGLSATHP